MRKRILLGLGTLLLILCALVLLRSSAASSAGQNVSVVFTGYTNDWQGARVAAFQVANKGKATIDWGSYNVEHRDHYRAASLLSLGPGLSLAPGQSRSFELPTSTNSEVWRVTLYCWPESRRRF